MPSGRNRGTITSAICARLGLDLLEIISESVVNGDVLNLISIMIVGALPRVQKKTLQKKIVIL